MPSPVRWIAAAALPIAAVVALLLLSGSDNSGSSEPRPAPTNAEPDAPIARSEYSNIYVLDLRSRTRVRLTANRDERFADFPAWSRSGRLAYSEAECEGCPAKLFTSGATESKRTRIPSDVVNTFQPSWSPDGRRIAIAKPGVGIYVTSVGTGKAVRLTHGEADEAPAWSPDGKLILFHRQVTPTNWDIYEMKPDGGSLHRLTRDPKQQLHPSWSPDGHKIAFAEQAANGNWVIFTMNADGTGRRQITDERNSSQDPSWSPDGTRIAFVAQAGGRESVAVIRIDGTGREILTGPALAVTAPSWSPRGDEIAFAAKDVGTHFAH